MQIQTHPRLTSGRGSYSFELVESNRYRVTTLRDGETRVRYMPKAKAIQLYDELVEWGNVPQLAPPNVTMAQLATITSGEVAHEWR